MARGSRSLRAVTAGNGFKCGGASWTREEALALGRGGTRNVQPECASSTGLAGLPAADGGFFSRIQ